MRTTVSDDRAFIEHVINNSILESSIDFIKDRFSAEEVYGKDILEIWALENGFISDSVVDELETEVESLKRDKADLEAENEVLQNEVNEHNE